MRAISRATDSVFLVRKTASQDPDVYLRRSDYPDMYDRDELEDAFDDGWHHYPDEPDLLHKTNRRGMTFSIHPTPNPREGENPYFMVLHNPEGISPYGTFASLSDATKIERDISSGASKIKDHLKPYEHQQLYVKLINDANANGGVAEDKYGRSLTVDGARDWLNRMKASEDSIAAGGDSLRRNLDEAYRARGIV